MQSSSLHATNLQSHRERLNSCTAHLAMLEVQMHQGRGHASHFDKTVFIQIEHSQGCKPSLVKDPGPDPVIPRFRKYKALGRTNAGTAHEINMPASSHSQGLQGLQLCGQLAATSCTSSAVYPWSKPTSTVHIRPAQSEQGAPSASIKPSRSARSSLSFHHPCAG